MTIFWIIAVGLLVFLVVKSFHSAAANISAGKQDYTAALKHREAAYRKKPNQNNGIQYGYLLLRSGDAERAEQVFGEVLQLEKLTEQNRFQIQLMMGLALWKKGDLDGAIRMYESFLKEGENTLVYANLGFLYLQRDSADAVMTFLQKAYEYNDSNPVILDNLAEGYLRTEQWEQAETLLSELVARPRPIAEHYYHYAVVLEHKEDIDGALKYYRKAAAMDLNALSGLDAEVIEKRIEKLERMTGNGDEL